MSCIQRFCLPLDLQTPVQGLEEQLLDAVARHERPELEEERGALAARVAADRGQLRALEATLLVELSRASGNILDNQARGYDF